MDTREQVMKLRAQGVTRVDIAERLGITVGAVHHHIRYVMYGPSGGPPTMDKEWAEKMWAEHKSVREISNATGIGLKHVGLILRNHGIKIKKTYQKSYKRLKPTFDKWEGALENSRPVSILDVKNGSCRWPIFDLGPKLLCGAPSHGVYCERHHEMSINDVELKEIRRPSEGQQMKMSKYQGYMWESIADQLADSPVPQDLLIGPEEL